MTMRPGPQTMRKVRMSRARRLRTTRPGARGCTKRFIGYYPDVREWLSRVRNGGLEHAQRRRLCHVRAGFVPLSTITAVRHIWASFSVSVGRESVPKFRVERGGVE